MIRMIPMGCSWVAAFLYLSATSIAQPQPLSFEEADGVESGEFTSLKTAMGVWTPTVGKTIIDHKHAKTGSQCLQLTGGKSTVVILNLADDQNTSGKLECWAERWTARAPFTFRIEKEVAGKENNWQEVFNGDRSVKVGRSFLNHLNIPLGDPTITRLRFSVSSPPNTGVLIDDIHLLPSTPQNIVDVSIAPMTLPALVGRQGPQASPIAKLRIKTEGDLNPISLRELQGKVVGVGLKNIRIAGTETTPDKNGNFSIRPKNGIKLTEGENTILVEGRLSADTDIDKRVGIKITGAIFADAADANSNSHRAFAFDKPPATQRLGVAVRNAGDDGVHTYRIPGLATSTQGTLIGVYDVRHRSGVDLPGDIDVGMSRSTDGGRTWEPMKIIMDMGEDPTWRYDGIGDPAILVDRNNGTIWVASTWSHGNRSWRGSGPGLDPEETGQFMLTRSDDDGQTWSAPINITKQVKRPEWCFLLQGPGKGITMQDGTLVFPAQVQDTPENNRLPRSTIIYSKDHGKTWRIGTGAFDDTTEAQVVEVEPGVLMLNCRYNRAPLRVVMTTRDLGKTWQKHPTSEQALIEPRACMASLIDTGSWLLFSNPDSLAARERITIKASPDRGLTWPQTNHLLLDEGRGFGYSCMTMIDEKTVGILYEGSQAQMTFQRIPLHELTDPLPPQQPSKSDGGN